MKIKKGDYVTIEYIDPDRHIYVGETVCVERINEQKGAPYAVETGPTNLGFQAFSYDEVRLATDVEILAAKLRGL